ncbi:MAG: radical SAM protein [Muribaculaceae bacterium]|nr:radical SAM protein [Muribaculaceae bacterium]
MSKLPTDISIITTYRCPMRCQMCNIWQNPTKKEEEITAKDLKILPNFKFVNITGGEPFVREDLGEIVELMFTKSPRIVISTSGWFEDRVIDIAKHFPNIGIRLSIEGMKAKNDELRGREGGFEKGVRTLRRLREMGIKDVGFGITVSNHNSADMLELYELAKELDMEFATAAFHNSFYFHKYDNVITNKDEVTSNFMKLIEMQLREPHPKSWFRAYFNMGLINYINGGKRLLPCEAGTVNFFIDPWGEVYPCNGLEESKWKKSMGNIRKAEKFEDIWFSKEADEVRELVRTCPKNCWMVGTASPVMKKYIHKPAMWVLDNKVRTIFGKPVKLLSSVKK